ncbi:hypothetical protein JCM1840_001584 [Sporobolomyces johnsonii]
MKRSQSPQASLHSPPPRHPTPDDLDADELDLLPPSSSNTPIHSSVVPKTATVTRKSAPAPHDPRTSTSSSASRPRTRQTRRTTGTFPTPSASPKNSSVGRTTSLPRQLGSERSPLPATVMLDDDDEQGGDSAFIDFPSKGPSASSPSMPRRSPDDKPSPAKRRRTSLAFKTDSIPSPGTSERKERPRRRPEQEEQERTGRAQREKGAGQPRLDEREQQRSRERDAPRSAKGKGKAAIKDEPDLADAAAKDLLHLSPAARPRPKPSPSQPQPDPASRSALPSPRQAAASPLTNSHPSTSSTSHSRAAPAPTQLSAVSSPRRTRAASPTPQTPPQPSPTSSSSKPATTTSSSSRRPPPTPTLAAFLASLPLPSLVRLTPHFATLGLSTPSDLLALAQPTESGRRVRRRVLERVDDALVHVAEEERRGGGGGKEEEGEDERRGRGRGRGMTEWERIVLEEELEVAWRRWMGVGPARDSSGLD